MAPITRLGVLGAGTMGAGIAQVAAEAGLQVTIHDPLPDAWPRAATRVTAALNRRVAKGSISQADADAALARVAPVDSVEALAAADAVIEAIPEDLGLKQEAFRRLDAAAQPHVLLATNTSSLPVAKIAAAATYPERVVGMHFFNPVALMALVEVIAAPRTDPAVVEATVALARQLGKTPVVAADTPGFIVNRVARPYYLESLRILGEGAADVAAIDDALRGMGFRMGPFELMDTIGLDVNLAVSQSVYEQFFFDERYRPHPIQRQLVDAGRLGRKAGGGFYDYATDGGRGPVWEGLARRSAAPHPPALDSATIEARLLAAMVNEAASAVADGTATPDAIDTAMRLGTNWPHGPLAWGERIGLERVVHTLDALHTAVPDGRYAVTPVLRSLAERGGSFFGTEA